MSFKVKVKQSFSKQLAKDEPQIGRIYQVIDLGMQSGGQYKDSRKVLITFELPDDLISDGDNKGKPLSISQEFTLSMHKKSGLRTKLINVIEGKELSDKEAENYDLTDLLGKTTLLNILHKASPKDPSVKYARIAGYSRVPKGMTIGSAINEPIILSLEDFDSEVFNKLPDWLKNKINKNDIPVEKLSSSDF